MSEVIAEALSETALRVTCHIAAPPMKVYEAWTQADQIARWFVPDPSSTCTVQTLDLKVGGILRLTLTDPDGAHVAHGVFTQLDPPARLAFTWQWETSQNERGVTQVTLDFHPDGDETRFVLTHEKLSGIVSRDLHAEGWGTCVASLATYLE